MAPSSWLAMTTIMKNFKVFARLVSILILFSHCRFHSVRLFLLVFLLWWAGTGFAESDLVERSSSLRSNVISKPKVPASYFTLILF